MESTQQGEFSDYQKGDPTGFSHEHVVATAELLYRVEQLIDSNLSSDSFFATLLKLLIKSLGAASGHVWHIQSENVTPMVQSVSKIENQFDLLTEEKKLAEVAFNGSSVTHRHTMEHPRTPAGFQRVCLIAPLYDHVQCFAVVTLIVYVRDPSEVQSRLHILEAATNRVRKSYVFQHLVNSAQQLSNVERAQTVTAGIGKYIEIKSLSHEAVNRLRSYLDCDRVTLAIKRGQKCSVKGISNQAVFDKRSNVVKQLEQLATKIATIEEPLWYPSENDSELAPSLKKALHKYFEVANAISVALIPLFAESKRRDDPEDIAATIQTDEQRLECIGVLIIEGLDTPLERETIQRRWARVKTSVSNSISNARRMDGLFLMPLWRKLGLFADFYRGHTRRKALIITGVVVALLVALVAIPGDFKLRGDGVIQPVQRQHIFAETEGTIKELYFVDGQTVKKNDLLMSLSNPELAAEIADVEGKLREASKRLETLTVQRVARDFNSDEDERELVRLAATTEARVTGLQKQIALLKESQAKLEVRSPMAGQIVTWDSKQRLDDRPVSRGERLITIASPSGKWEVELRIPDKRAGYLLKHWQKTRRSKSESMEVSFVLASNPSEVFRGTVSEVSPNSNVDDLENENVVRVRIELTKEEVEKIKTVKPGTTVTGHIHCGRASIGYCKLYEFFDWTQRMWFKFVS